MRVSLAAVMLSLLLSFQALGQETKPSVIEAGREFFERHGIDPDADDAWIQIQVEVRKQTVFGRIFSTCYLRTLGAEVSTKQYVECLHEQEEVERRLGNLP